MVNGVLAFTIFLLVGSSGLILFAGIFTLVVEFSQQVRRQRKPKNKRKNEWL